MALYEGEEMVTVEAGGRSMQVPASVAAQLGLNPVSAPPPAPSMIGPGQAPQNETRAESVGQSIPAATPATPMPTNWLPTSAIDQGIAQAADPSLGARIDAMVLPEVVANEPAHAAQPKPAPAPAGKQAGPPKPGQQGLGGYEDGWKAQETAGANQEAALQNTADTESIGQLALAGAMAERNQRTDKLFDERAQQAQANIDAIAKRNADYDAAIQKFANTKIDRSIDHPVLAGVSIALAGLGMAMMGRGAEENPALKALYQSIDRKVAGQMQDLEKTGKVLGYQKDSIERMRGMASDQLAFKNMLIAGETERAARSMEEIGARTNSEVLKARAKEGAMALRARVADLKMAAIDKQNDADQKVMDRKQRDTENKRSVGAQNYATATGYKMHKEKLQFDREKLDYDMGKAFLDAEKTGNKARAELLGKAAKENSERAVGDKNGNYILQPKGKKLFEEAAKLEEKASQVEKQNPQAAQVMRSKAEQIRVDVLADEADGVWRASSGDAKAKTVAQIASVQQMTNLGRDIQNLALQHGRQWLGSSAGQQVIASKYIGLLMAEKNIDQLGVLSKTDVALLRAKLGDDPSKWDMSKAVAELTDNLVGDDPEGFRKVIDERIADSKKNAAKALRTAGFKGNAGELWDDEEKINADGPAAQSYRTITGDKSIDKQLEGVDKRDAKNPMEGAAMGMAQTAIFGHTERDAINSKREFDGSILSKDQATAADDLIARAKTRDPEAVGLLQKAIEHPEFGAAIRGRVERSGLLEEKAASIDPIPVLAQKATVDRASFDQLSKIAAQGDETAKAYLKGVIDFKARLDNRPLADKPVWDRRPAKIGN